MMKSKYVFIDLEASGLHNGSYPIEAGWAWQDQSVESYLIIPEPSWDESNWSYESQAIHDIKRQQLFDLGKPARWVAEKLNDEFTDKIVCSDSPNFDGMWLNVLYNTVQIKPSFVLEDSNGVLISLAMRFGIEIDKFEDLSQQARNLAPHTHRAADDALYYPVLWNLLLGRTIKKKEESK